MSPFASFGAAFLVAWRCKQETFYFNWPPFSWQSAYSQHHLAHDGGLDLETVRKHCRTENTAGVNIKILQICPFLKAGFAIIQPTEKHHDASFKWIPNYFKPLSLNRRLMTSSSTLNDVIGVLQSCMHNCFHRLTSGSLRQINRRLNSAPFKKKLLNMADKFIPLCPLPSPLHLLNQDQVIWSIWILPSRPRCQVPSEDAALRISPRPHRRLMGSTCPCVSEPLPARDCWCAVVIGPLWGSSCSLLFSSLPLF